MGTLLAGVARATITPPVGIALMGYAAREHGSVGVHDDLAATALVLSDGKTRLAIVTCDLIFVHPHTVDRIRALSGQRTGIPGENIMLCCSHTHSGPVPFVDPSENGDTSSAGDSAAEELARAYLENLVYLIVGAIAEANAELQPAAWGVGRGEVMVGANRRQRLANGRMVLGENPGGTIDPALLVLRVVQDREEEGLAGRALATLVNHACHAVSLSSNSYLISADWPGAMRCAVEPAVGGMAGFVQGAGADINPLDGPQDSFDQAQRLGSQAARAVLDLCPCIPLRRDIRLRAARRECWLPLLPLDGEPIAPEGAAPAFERLAARITGVPLDRIRSYLRQRFPWAADVVYRPEETSAHGGGWYAPMEVQVLRLGDVVLVALAAEPFVEIGLEIKRRAAAAQTWVAGYTNGSISYLPTRGAYEEKGYEVDTAYIYYRLPAPLAPGCAERVVDTALALIEETNEFPA